MYLPLYVEHKDVVEAEALIANFGRAAGIEAADRAEASRHIGNHLQFCRWRQDRKSTRLNSSHVD